MWPVVIKRFVFIIVFLFLAACNVSKPAFIERNVDGRIHRSETAKNRFKHEHPCPTNGHKSGPCPGYVIDHVKPLACGGADDPSNMQWQTIEEGKAKDKWELKYYCRK
jgi:hypothetical protein